MNSKFLKVSLFATMESNWKRRFTGQFLHLAWLMIKISTPQILLFFKRTWQGHSRETGFPENMWAWSCGSLSLHPWIYHGPRGMITEEMQAADIITWMFFIKCFLGLLSSIGKFCNFLPWFYRPFQSNQLHLCTSSA